MPVIKFAINNNIINAEGFMKSIEVYKASKNKKASSKTNSSTNKSKEFKFNNFLAREYDYDSLEKKPNFR